MQYSCVTQSMVMISLHLHRMHLHLFVHSSQGWRLLRGSQLTFSFMIRVLLKMPVCSWSHQSRRMASWQKCHWIMCSYLWLAELHHIFLTSSEQKGQAKNCWELEHLSSRHSFSAIPQRKRGPKIEQSISTGCLGYSLENGEVHSGGAPAQNYSPTSYHAVDASNAELNSDTVLHRRRHVNKPAGAQQGGNVLFPHISVCNLLFIFIIYSFIREMG